MAPIPTSMRAWQYSNTAGGLEANLKLNAQAALPPSARKLASNEVLVEVVAASLNPADYKVQEIPLIGRFIVTKPASPGLDYAGRVVLTGTGSNLNEGQLVFGRFSKPVQYGPLSEYTVVPAEGCVPIPKGVDPDDAACLGTAALTAYQCLMPNLKCSDRVFINGGSGGCGVFGIQFAKVMGGHVVTTCSTANVELCKSLGADEVIDYRNSDVLAELRKIGNFDLVVDHVATPRNLYWEAHTFTKPGAKFVQVGSSPTLPEVYHLASRLLWPTFLGGGKRKFEVFLAKTSAKDLSQIAEWMREGKARAVIAEKFTFDDDGPIMAFEKLRSGRAKGKLVVKVRGADV